MMHLVQMLVEIPKGSNVKYEFNKRQATIEVDRILREPMPYNYGFVPDTLWDDGDALDVILVGNFSLHPATRVMVKPRAVIFMEDNGTSDYKLVCTVNDEDLKDTTIAQEILPYLTSYKLGVQAHNWSTDETTVQKIIQASRINYLASDKI